MSAPWWSEISLVFKYLWGHPIVLIRDNYTTGPSLSALMKSTILQMVCVCNSKVRVCLSLVLMDRAETRGGERANKISKTEWVTA